MVILLLGPSWNELVSSKKSISLKFFDFMLTIWNKNTHLCVAEDDHERSLSQKSKASYFLFYLPDSPASRLFFLLSAFPTAKYPVKQNGVIPKPLTFPFPAEAALLYFGSSLMTQSVPLSLCNADAQCRSGWLAWVSDQTRFRPRDAVRI